MTETNNPYEFFDTDPVGIDVLAYLEGLPEDAGSPAQRAEHYDVLKPALLRLSSEDPIRFSLALEETEKRLRLKSKVIQADVAEASTDEGKGRQSQATILVDLASDVELWHTPDGEAWATIPTNNHSENWQVKTKLFRRWLARRFHEKIGGAVGAQGLQDALTVLEGKALFDGEAHPVYTRLAEHEGTIFLDLANADWEAVAITCAGWQVVAAPPVRFRRARGMLPLPHPIAGGKADALFSFVDITDSDNRKLLIAWLLAALRPRGPYPVLVLQGEQGSAKSTTARILRALVDPNEASLRAEPRDARDLIIAATNGWIVALDNLSHIQSWLSDGLCRLSTGGGFTTRELYTDSEEVIFNAQRPSLLNGIEEITTRPDLLDRAIPLSLPAIPEQERKQEAVLWSAFEQARPAILGGLLDAVVSALANLGKVKLTHLPRMADFAVWATAAESYLEWKESDFCRAYERSRTSTNNFALDASAIGESVQRFIAKQDTWEGSASELLELLCPSATEKELKSKNWPKLPFSLSNQLRRISPNLRTVGIEVEFTRSGDKGRARKIKISRTEPEQERKKASVASEHEQKQSVTADARGSSLDAVASDLKPSKFKNLHSMLDATDTTDAKKRTHSNLAPLPDVEIFE
ncbi:MAG: hypothetical protein EXR78_02800 [Deltaproteobacteria bacterium]|nr:hypothetical protein [Deltaproteobacteria bacterium]